jgi:serine/threonine-protein kinase ATR
VNAVLRASRLGSTDAVIQNARLLWAEGHHQKAIKTLEGFLTTHPLGLSDLSSFGHADSRNTSMTQNQKQKSLAADAQLLLAKWLDRAGQTSSEMIQKRYRDAIQLNKKWEKGYFSLGKYYNKLLDSEKAKPSDKQADTYVTGEVFKLAIENYIRSMPFGFKYIFRSLPKILTLWLDLASSVDHPMNFRRDENEKVEISGITKRKKILDLINAQIKKYLEKIPACSLYTGLPQVLARICHSNLTVQAVLTSLIVKIVSSFPQQALWTLLAVCKSSSKDRSARGQDCLKKMQNSDKRSKPGSNGLDVRALVNSGYKLSDELLRICEADVHGKPQKISLFRDLSFDHKLAPCKLVVPLETTLSPSLPPNLDQDKMVGHAAFPQDTITISTFLDDVLVLSSLQKPRKLKVRGSDGEVYGLLCKPKDDLRKDQRLMEFNTMINRILKRDDESSKRKLYIKTYAVTPLNEECGLIEWVDNLKTLRDILLKMYKERNVAINYNEIRQLLDEACYNETKLHIFADRILAQFRPVFYEWFVEMFPEPEQWFTARLRYTRSCAVMSMVGHVLGLGDRHGENILFQEDSGGTLHVDFNCLFDKGLTFEKPELVPFRLTHNMVDAFGAYGYDGPFRRSCELTMGLLRQNEDALMTILETFLYDPTTDFIGKKVGCTSFPPRNLLALLILCIETSSCQRPGHTGRSVGIGEAETEGLVTEGIGATVSWGTCRPFDQAGG